MNILYKSVKKFILILYDYYLIIILFLNIVIFLMLMYILLVYYFYIKLIIFYLKITLNLKEKLVNEPRVTKIESI